LCDFAVSFISVPKGGLKSLKQYFGGGGAEVEFMWNIRTLLTSSWTEQKYKSSLTTPLYAKFAEGGFKLSKNGVQQFFRYV
jgi:hypothetical protein